MAKKIFLDKKQITSIINDYKSGMTLAQITDKNKLSTTYIKKILLSNNIELRKYNEKISDDIVKEWIYLYEDGYSSIEISRKFNVDDSTILNHLKKNSIKIRTDTHWKAPKLTNETIKLELIDNYRINSTKTIKSISKETGISTLTISKLFNSRHVEINNRNRKWNFNEDFFKLENWKLAYFWGFCLGDGCLYRSKKTSRIQITLHEKDKIILETFCDWLDMSKEAIYKIPKKNTVSLIISSEIFKGDFSRFGIIPNKTYNPITPAEDFSLAFLKPFIVGLVDADGTIRTNKGKYRRFGLTCNKKVINWFIKSIRRLGFNEEIKLEMPQNKIWGKALIYKHKHVEKLISLISPAKYFNLSRKWNQI